MSPIAGGSEKTAARFDGVTILSVAVTALASASVEVSKAPACVVVAVATVKPRLPAPIANTTLLFELVSVEKLGSAPVLQIRPKRG